MKPARPPAPSSRRVRTLPARGALVLAALLPMLALTAVAPAAADADAAKPAAARPNVVVVLVDDMGFSDIGCYGGEISTPNLDKLAAGGVRFTQFYNTARCCPTRASLLTGLYPHQAGVGHMTDPQYDAAGAILPGYTGRLNDRCVTIAEALKRAGYFTAMAGKWHVGQNHGVTAWTRGFDRSLTAASGGFYFPDSTRTGGLFLNGRDVSPKTGDAKQLPAEWYSTDLWTDYGLKFVDEAKAADKPFFLYVAHNAPHFPLQAPAADIARWRGKYKAGWDKLREARYARQVQAGIVEKAWPVSPRLDGVPAWDSLTPDQQDKYDHEMAIYAAVVEHMDKAVGRLVDGLRDRGVLDNTLVLFMSDNGGNAEAGVPGRLEGPGEPGGPKSTVFVGQCWATLNNTPFVRYKHFTDEGGISTPLIAHWPKGIPADRNGKLEKQPGHLVDIMATCLDVTGATYPADRDGKPTKPLQGVSLRPAFEGNDLNRGKPIFWEHEGNRAVRDGQWKLVAVANKPWRLYDMAADRTEQHDLAAEHPEKVKALAAAWDAYAARSDVLPLGGWKAGGKPAAVAGAATGAATQPAGKGKRKNAANVPPVARTKFELKAGDRLERDEAPTIVGRAITVTAKFDAKGVGAGAAPAAGGATATDGVILAQGGAVNGYVLYLKDGKPAFTYRAGGKSTTVTAPAAAAAGPHTAVAKLAADGTVSLTVDGGPPIADKASGFIPKAPLDGLDVGSDQGGLVGPYAAENMFAGTIESVVVEVTPAPPGSRPSPVE
jgi:arylsulfatase A-like enzyme